MPTTLTAPVDPPFKVTAPVPLAVMVIALLASVEVMSVPMVPLKTKPLVKVPEVLVISMPLVVVPAEFWLNKIPLVEVPLGTPVTTSKTSAEVALVVPLMVSPTIDAAVGEMTLLEGVLALFPVGTWTIQVEQVPAGIQDKTEVAAPPSVERTWPAEPSAIGRIYVTALVVELEDLIVVEVAEVFPKTNDPWVVEALPKVKLPLLSKEALMLVPSETVKPAPAPAWEITKAAPVAELLDCVTPTTIPESVPPAEFSLEVICKAAAESVLAPVTTVRFRNTSGVVSLAEILPVRLI